MTKIHIQRGGVLSSALGFTVFVAVILFLIAILAQPYTAISDERNKELQSMVESVSNTPFEKTFKDRINYNLQDGKISNSEFLELSEMLSGYKTAKLTGEDKNFNVQAKKNLENQYKADKFSGELYKWIFLIVGGIIVLCIILFGWKKMTGDF